jgi:hypothetical protein
MGGAAAAGEDPSVSEATRSLGRTSGRSEVLIVRTSGGLGVKKIFRPSAHRHLQRELFARAELSHVLPEVPHLLEAGDDYVVSPYYSDSLRYRRAGLRLFPLTAARRVVDFLQRLYDQGYAMLDAHPENVLFDEHGSLRIVDCEFLKPYGSLKPPSFAESWDIVGPPADFDGDRPRGGCPTWRTHWQLYVGLSLHELQTDPVPLQRLKRVRHWFIRFLPRWIDTRLPQPLLHVKAIVGTTIRTITRTASRNRRG